MITTITTTAGEQFATAAGILSVVVLIGFLIAKELLGAATQDTASSEASTLTKKTGLLVEKTNIVIASMLFVFAAIVLTKIAEVL